MIIKKGSKFFLVATAEDLRDLDGDGSTLVHIATALSKDVKSEIVSDGDFVIEVSVVSTKIARENNSVSLKSTDEIDSDEDDLSIDDEEDIWDDNY